MIAHMLVTAMINAPVYWLASSWFGWWGVLVVVLAQVTEKIERAVFD